MVERKMRSAKATAGQLRCDDSAVRRPSGMQPFRPAAVREEGEQTAAHAGGKAECIGCCCSVHRQNPGSGARCRDRSDDAGGMEAARMEAAASYGTEPCGNLVADGD